LASITPDGGVCIDHWAGVNRASIAGLSRSRQHALFCVERDGRVSTKELGSSLVPFDPHEYPGEPPVGSYQRTCDPCAYDKSTTVLSCVCLADQAALRASTLTTRRCGVQDIRNVGGVLACTPGNLLPGGSYQQSCGQCRYDPGTTVLSCQCLRSNRSFLQTTSLFTGCCAGQDISNADGALTCSACDVRRR
jgi:hypothetical protein